MAPSSGQGTSHSLNCASHSSKRCWPFAAGYRGSGFVLWHRPEIFGAAAILSGFRETSAAPARWQACGLVTHFFRPLSLRRFPKAGPASGHWDYQLKLASGPSQLRIITAYYPASVHHSRSACFLRTGRPS
jgi:hypothetical protein